MTDGNWHLILFALRAASRPEKPAGQLKFDTIRMATADASVVIFVHEPIYKKRRETTLSLSLSAAQPQTSEANQCKLTWMPFC